MCRQVRVPKCPLHCEPLSFGGCDIPGVHCNPNTKPVPAKPVSFGGCDIPGVKCNPNNPLPKLKPSSSCKCRKPKSVPSQCEVDILIDLMELAVHKDKKLSAQWLRLAFHDAGTFDQENGIGGANGCLVTHKPMRDEKENSFLDLPINTLVVIKRAWEKSPKTCIRTSSADIVQFAGLFGSARQVGGNGMTSKKRNQLKAFEWGRPDEPDCKTWWTSHLPGFELGNHDKGVAVRCKMAGGEIKKKMMDKNGFSAKEATALIGAHTIGLTRETFGEDFAGPWVTNGADRATPNGPVFDNSYFDFLLNEIPAKTAKQFQENQLLPFDRAFPTWLRVEATNLNHLDTDLALAFPTQNTRTHPDFHRFTRRYARNNLEFLRDFFSALSKMGKLGVGRRLSRSGTCTKCVKRKRSRTRKRPKRFSSRRGRKGSLGSKGAVREEAVEEEPDVIEFDKQKLNSQLTKATGTALRTTEVKQAKREQKIEFLTTELTIAQVRGVTPTQAPGPAPASVDDDDGVNDDDSAEDEGADEDSNDDSVNDGPTSTSGGATTGATEDGVDDDGVNDDDGAGDDGAGDDDGANDDGTGTDDSV